MGMTDQPANAASEREEIIARVAHFKATQQKFEREREEYFVATLEGARHSHGPRRTVEDMPFWS
jgi:chorismate mutase